MVKDAAGHKLKIALIIVSVIALLVIIFLAWLIFVPSGPSDESAIGMIMEVDDAIVDRLDLATSEYDLASGASYDSEESISQGKERFVHLQGEFLALKSNLTYTADIARQAIPDKDGDKKIFLELSLDCDEKRIDALELLIKSSSNYQSLLNYISAAGVADDKYSELTGLISRFQLYIEVNDRSNALLTIDLMQEATSAMVAAIEEADSFIHLPSLDLYSQWGEVYGEVLSLSKRSLESGGSQSQSDAQRSADKAVEASTLLDDAFSGVETEMSSWRYTNIDKLEDEASRLLDSAAISCGNAADKYYELYPY